MSDVTVSKGSRAVDAAIRSRRSIRAFLSKPVARADIEAILEAAARAPSGTNMQPWRVIVLTGAALRDFCAGIQLRVASGEPAEAQYSYYPPTFREPYLARRRKVGWDLYGALGIVKGDKTRMAAQHARNFDFFDAPVGMMFTIDADLELGSWLDYGMFLENIMIAARGRGLDTCAQAAFVGYHKTIRALLGLGEDQHIVCGMALGYADMTAPENTFETTREPVADFARFIDTLPIPHDG
jgi:nitroreductase